MLHDSVAFDSMAFSLLRVFSREIAKNRAITIRHKSDQPCSNPFKRSLPINKICMASAVERDEICEMGSKKEIKQEQIH